MPVTVSYPGIYIQEAPSSSHAIVAAPTNIAAFIGYSHPLKTPAANFGQAVQVFGFMDYQRLFGGFVRSAAFTYAAQVTPAAGTGPVFSPPASPPAGPEDTCGDLAVAVNQFFLNGGTNAYICALTNASLPATGAVLPAAAMSFTEGLTFTTLEITDEVYQMSLNIMPLAAGASTMVNDPLADIVITYGPVSPPATAASGPGTTVETYRRVSLNKYVNDSGGNPTTVLNPNYIETRIGTATAMVSALVTVSAGAAAPAGGYVGGSNNFPVLLPSDTAFVAADDFTAALQEEQPLDKVPVVNLMVIPGVTDTLVLSTALSFCERKLAFLIVDPIITDSADGTLTQFPIMVQNNTAQTVPRGKNAALYFPYLQSPDVFTGSNLNPVTGQTNEIPPSATVAGIYAATDVARGVWKAPAGFQAVANNTTGVVARGQMTDMRQGVLNPISVNCLRQFPNVGTIVFGSRTLASTYDQQWTYVPVRRMALFLEQTFLANLKWVLFEPNAEPLWTAITMSLNAFMLGLFKQGAFQGDTPSQAFQVQCNSQTTTQADIESGIVNIVVSFAPLSPAEFVVITIAQLAGQSQTS